MSKTYYLAFGSANPSSYTGLSPSFLVFSAGGLTSITPPGITEGTAGTGIYRFQYGPTQSVVFVVDGGSALSSTDRYIKGALDPLQAVDETIGQTGDSFGSTATDPSTVLGYCKRNLEFNEGNKNFTKSTGIWDISSRGSSTLLREKTLTNSVTSASSS